MLTEEASSRANLKPGLGMVYKAEVKDTVIHVFILQCQDPSMVFIRDFPSRVLFTGQPQSGS